MQGIKVDPNVTLDLYIYFLTFVPTWESRGDIFLFNDNKKRKSLKGLVSIDMITWDYLPLVGTRGLGYLEMVKLKICVSWEKNKPGIWLADSTAASKPEALLEYPC